MPSRPIWSVLVILLAARAGAADVPDAAALVRKARADEAWIDRVESFRLTAEVAWERTPRGIARRRKEMHAQRPGVNVDDAPDLRPRGSQHVELAFDRRRVRARDVWPWGVDDLRVWDGKRFIGREIQGRDPERVQVLFSRDPGDRLGFVFSSFASFRAAPRASWWLSAKAREELARMTTRPEEFAYAGRDRFDGTECEVVCRWGSWERLYFADGRLRGLKIGTQANPGFNAKFVDYLRREGPFFRDLKEWPAWYRSLPPEEARALELRLSAAMLTLTDPIFEFGLADYREAAPGCWLPMTQTTTTRFIDDDGSNAIEQIHTLKVTEVRVNEPLPDKLFEVEVRPGAKVVDQTSNPPLTYNHKADFTPEEWAAIVARGKAMADRDEAHARRQAALIGTLPPAFPDGATWIDGSPVRWEDLRGKAVLLDFWAEWCGPCRGDLPALAGVHQKRAENGLVVIGVHPPGSDPAAIAKVRKDFNLAYPTVVDAPPPDGAGHWGAYYGKLGVDRIPHAVLVGRNGKIVATGAPEEVLPVALENR